MAGAKGARGVTRQFRWPGHPAPAKPPQFPHKPPANSPPYRLTHPRADVRRVVEATLAARKAEGDR